MDNKKIESKLKKSIQKKIISILKRNDVVKAGIFGSYAKGEAKKDSDIDILVEIDKKIGLFDFVGIKLELEEKLGKKVDLLTYKSIHPYIKKSILANEVRII